MKTANSHAFFLLNALSCNKEISDDSLTERTHLQSEKLRQSL